MKKKRKKKSPRFCFSLMFPDFCLDQRGNEIWLILISFGRMWGFEENYRPKSVVQSHGWMNNTRPRPDSTFWNSTREPWPFVVERQVAKQSWANAKAGYERAVIVLGTITGTLEPGGCRIATFIRWLTKRCSRHAAYATRRQRRGAFPCERSLW